VDPVRGAPGHLAEGIMLSWLKILCAVDFSESSRHALELACDLAQRLGAELTLVHAYEEAPAIEVPLPPDVFEHVALEAERQLAQWRGEAERRTGRKVEMQLVRGDAGIELPQLADRGLFDLLVTGTHGRTGVKRAVMGSVAEKLVRHAPCPVLVARRPVDHGD
jgi:nucleotide-binding universal stress UspA family protein